MSEIPTVTRDELVAMRDRDEPFVLLEALPERDYARAHLPGALNLLPEDARDLAPELLPDRNAKIVVYCANSACHNSTLLALKLAALGYRDVVDYEAGKEDWLAAGLPTESAAASWLGAVA